MVIEVLENNFFGLIKIKNDFFSHFIHLESCLQGVSKKPLFGHFLAKIFPKFFFSKMTQGFYGRNRLRASKILKTSLRPRNIQFSYFQVGIPTENNFKKYENRIFHSLGGVFDARNRFFA